MVYFTLSKPVLYNKYNTMDSKLLNYNKFLLADSHGNALQQKDLEPLGIGNLSYDSDSYFDLLVKTKYLLERAKVDTLFITCDDHTLSKYRESWTNRHRSVRYSEYDLHKKYYRSSYFDFLVLKYVRYFLPLMDTKNSKIFKLYMESRRKGELFNDFSDFSFATLSLEKQQERSLDRVKTHYPNNEPSEKMTKCLAEIISICDAKKVKLIGVKFPLSNSFLEALGSNGYGADCILLEKEIEIYDFKESFARNTHFFRDQDHVNKLGSNELAKLLGAKLAGRVR